MKTILLFGAGKSATVLIDFLIAEAAAGDWKIRVADSDQQLILGKTKGASCTEAIVLDINHADQRAEQIRQADIVISMMPPALHILIARDCLDLGKNLLTASYVDDALRTLEPALKQKGLLFLCEMGLDPGIDHMSAMKMIHEIKAAGGAITSFKSHCGGLVAPESDDNPWHYKISWNPRNIVMAGKAGAIYKLDGAEKHEKYEELFQPERGVYVNEELGFLSWYPNRDSLSYIDLYGLHDAKTFMRTTFRHPDFMYGWNKVIELKMTDEGKKYESSGKSLADCFLMHFEELKRSGLDPDSLKATEPFSKQLDFLGMNDRETLVNKGFCSAMDILQSAMERKLALQPQDKDMIVMLHELEYEQDGKTRKTDAALVVKGEDSLHTAMAKTVGLPLGIAAKLILNGTIKLTGLHIPVDQEIYEPVLKELEGSGIRFVERVRE